MKKTLFLMLICFCTGAGFLYGADNPFLGVWELEVIGVEEIIILEFFEDSTLLVTNEDGDREERQYQLDRRQGRIYLDLGEDMGDTWSYFFEGDEEFFLYVVDESSLLIQGLTQSFAQAREEYINQITDEFWELLIQKVTEAVMDSPMAWGIRLDG